MIRILFLLLSFGLAHAEPVVANPSHSFTGSAPKQKQKKPSQVSISSHREAQKPVNECPSRCSQEIAVRNQILDVKYRTQEMKHSTQELLHGKSSTHVPGKKPPHFVPSSNAGSCHADCKNVMSQKEALVKAESEFNLATKEHKDAQAKMAHAGKPGDPTHAGAKANTCPRNCHEAVAGLHKVHGLRVQIEQAKHAQNPNYTMRTINEPAVQDKGEHCQADCAQVKGIQREIQKYEAELTKVKSTHVAAPVTGGHSTALVPHQSQNVGASSVSPPKLSSSDVAAMSHPKELCPNVGQMLKRILAVEQQIHGLNPNYKVHTAPVDLSQFRQGSCSAESPTVMQLRTIQGTLKLYLEDLQKHGHSGTAIAGPSKPLALPAPHSATSTALAPHTPVAANTCPKNCHEAVVALQGVYKLRQEIEQAKHAQNPNYTMRQINPPTMQDSGQKCHADCPQVQGIQRQVDKYKAELAQIHSASGHTPSSTALVPHTPVAAGTCPKNCHEAWYMLHEIYDVRQKIEQVKHAKAADYQMQVIKAPTMQDSAQHCHADCAQVLGIQRQLKKYQDELAAIGAGNALPAPQQGLKGKCTPGCDNETALRVKIQTLNKQAEQLKHKADPSYRMKTFKPIAASKTGQQCPVGCDNIKQLEKRKTQLEQSIAQLKSQPIIEEPEGHPGALVPYQGGISDDDELGVVPVQKKPGFMSRLKTKVKGAASTVKRKFSRKPSSGSSGSENDYSQLPQSGGQLVPYNDGSSVDDDDYSVTQNPPQNPRPPRNSYNPYGTNDEQDYSQGYGYNHQTGNYDSYGNQMSPYNGQTGGQGYGQGGYGYDPYGGGSSVTHEESGPMYPYGYPSQGGDIATSNTDGNNPGANAGAAAMAAFGSILGGLMQQPAAVAPAVPAQQPAVPAPQAQAVAPYGQSGVTQDVAPQDGDDYDALYGGNGGDYAPAGSGSSYGGTSSNYGSGSSYGSSSTGSSYGSTSGSYGSGSSYPSSSRSSASSYDDYGY